MVKATCTDEGFQVYKTYNKFFHQKEENKKSGYDRFLCLQGLDFQTLTS